MIETINVVQGSPEWHALRLGVVTASQLDRVIQPVKRKPSAGWDGYAHQLIAEIMIGAPLDSASSGFLERGTALEANAVQYYEFTKDVETQPGGFVFRDETRKVGCSPDRHVGKDGLLEIKSPSPAVHVGYLLAENPFADDYTLQVQGQLWVTGREWCDTLSYHPVLPSAIVREYRNPEYIADIERCVNQFLLYVDGLKTRLHRMGYLPDHVEMALKLA